MNFKSSDMEHLNMADKNRVEQIHHKEIPKQEHQKISFLGRLKSIVATITVEPLMVFFITSSMMATLTTENLNLEKSCRVNIGYNKSVCDAMVIRNRSGYTADQEIQVQKLVSSMLAYKTAVQGIIPFVLMVFLGSWSDRHRRRKPFILMPIYGDIVSSLGYIFCTYFFLELSVEYAIFFEAIPVSVTGGWFCFFVGVYSYVTEKSSEETRTIRIGTATMFTHVSLTMGIALSGVTFKLLGFYGVYGLSLFMFTLAVFYGIIMIKDDHDQDDATLSDNNVKNEFQNIPEKSFLKDLFDYHHIVNTFSICFKKESNNRRIKLCLVMILVLLNVGSYRGELTVMYMFTRRKFTWDELDYSGYNTYHSVTQMLGASLCLAIFVKWMKVDDATLGMIGMASKIVGCFASGFAPNPIYFYLGELTVMYMFTRRKFTWDELDYSGYNTYHSVTQMLGASLCLAIFVKWMKVDDATLGMIGMASKIVGCFASGFAPNPIYFYLAALTEIFNGSSHIAMRSIMSKLVSADELGKMFSIFGLCEALTPLLCGPLYSFVYHHTIDVFPGAFYFVSALLHTGAFFIFLWLYVIRKLPKKCGHELKINIGTKQMEELLKEEHRC